MSGPFLGFGVGLRVEHYEEILNDAPAIDWLEILTENYLVPGGKPLHYLDRFRERYPLVMHGVSLSVGSSDEINWNYLQHVRALARRIEPAWISDHLCWTGIDQVNLHDLMPLPYTEEALVHVVQRVQRIQDYLGRQLLLENVSSYVDYACSEMSEWAFLNAIAERADCLILLDINNLYVSGRNHAFDPVEYLAGITPSRVQQLHIAGHDDQDDLVIDTHDSPVVTPVWQLLAQAYARFGEVSTMIERDSHVPPLAILLDELTTARQIAAKSLSKTPE